jgi:hypothetical protein
MRLNQPEIPLHLDSFSRDESWPDLPLHAWQETYATLHRWMQIAGKIRLQLSPFVNHWWHVPFYVTGRGLTTSLIPYGRGGFEILFDFIDHQLIIETSKGERQFLELRPRSVADFYGLLMELLRELDIKVKIFPKPAEIIDAVSFDKDDIHSAYDAEYAHRLWRILMETEQVLRKFRSRFIGKCSPIHFFWGGFDMAVTRFSGRRAPLHPPVPYIPVYVTTEAYSHEVSSCGFWPGSGPIQEPAFYSYAYPEPEGFKSSLIHPRSAFYSRELGEFLLPYDCIRTSLNPEQELLSFFQTTYEAAAEAGKWDRKNLERD